MKRSGLALLLVTLLAILAGVYFRVARLDRRLFWFDECYTALKLSGHRGYVAAEAVLDGQVRPIDDVRRYQRLDPQHGFLDTVKRCAGSDPQVAPLHCLALRVWAPVFGDSVTSLRAFSVVLGLLCLPAIAWLGHEVVGGQKSSLPLVAAGLMAVSPFEVLYSQEAREYALWTLMVLLSSAALLRALRTGGRNMWRAYALLTAVAVYSHLLHLIVVLVHGIVTVYAARREGSEPMRRSAMRSFLLYGGVGVAALLPWVGVLIIQATHAMDAVAWTANRIGPGAYLDRVLRGIGAVMLDWGANGLTAWRRIALTLIVLGAGLALALAGWRARRATHAAGWTLILLLPLVPAAILGGADLLLGGSRMIVPRYMTPAYVGLILAFASAISLLLDSTPPRRRIAGAIGLAVFLAAGTCSCWRLSNSVYWWNKAASSLNPPCAQLIHSATTPLLIVDPQDLNFGNLLSLSHIVDDRLRFVGEPNPNVDLRPFDRILVYNPGDDFLERVRTRTGMTPELVTDLSPRTLYQLRRSPGN